MTNDFRHYMGCPDCWAYWLEVSPLKLHCRLSREEMNRPDNVPPDKTRMDMQVRDYVTLERWPCEYRYSAEEVQKIQSGDIRGAQVTKQVAAQVLGALNTLQDGMVLGNKYGNKTLG